MDEYIIQVVLPNHLKKQPFINHIKNNFIDSYLIAHIADSEQPFFLITPREDLKDFTLNKFKDSKIVDISELDPSEGIYKFDGDKDYWPL